MHTDGSGSALAEFENEALLAGNATRGEKFNLYRALAQLGSRGRTEARTLGSYVSESSTMFAPGPRQADGRYALETREMDPGDCRLMYGVYTLRR